MLIERLATGDTADQSTSQLIGGRDCNSIDDTATYTRCATGGFVFPQNGGRHRFSGLTGTTTPILYVRDDLATPAAR